VSLTDQLILRDNTLRVLSLAAPNEAIGRQVALARDPMNGGHLTVTQVRALAAAAHLTTPLDANAIAEARRDIETALARIDLDALAAAGRTVSLFVWEEERDGPRRTIDDHDH
jgi:hypothetical protein